MKKLNLKIYTLYNKEIKYNNNIKMHIFIRYLIIVFILLIIQFIIKKIGTNNNIANNNVRKINTNNLYISLQKWNDFGGAMGCWDMLFDDPYEYALACDVSLTTSKLSTWSSTKSISYTSSSTILMTPIPSNILSNDGEIVLDIFTSKSKTKNIFKRVSITATISIPQIITSINTPLQSMSRTNTHIKSAPKTNTPLQTKYNITTITITSTLYKNLH